MTTVTRPALLSSVAYIMQAAGITLADLAQHMRPTARWQAQQLPADPRWPSFSSTPLGVNPDTGRPWA